MSSLTSGALTATPVASKTGLTNRSRNTLACVPWARRGAKPPIWTPNETGRRPYLVNYRKGPLVLAALEARIGREAFDQFMRRYMVERIPTTPDLLTVLEEVAGVEHRAWFEAQLAE